MSKNKKNVCKYRQIVANGKIYLGYLTKDLEFGAYFAL